MRFEEKNHVLLVSHQGERLRIEAWGADSLRVRASRYREFTERDWALTEDVPEEQRKADEGMTGGAGVVEYETEVMGVETKVTGKVILLSASSILGVIFVAVSSSCIFVVIQKPKEILSKMS